MNTVAPVLLKLGCTKPDRRVTINGQKHTVWLGVKVPATDESGQSGHPVPVIP